MSKHFEVDLHQQIWTILHTHFSIQTHSFCLQFAIICLQIFFCRLFRQIKTYNHLTEITTTKLNANSSNCFNHSKCCVPTDCKYATIELQFYTAEAMQIRFDHMHTKSMHLLSSYAFFNCVSILHFVSKFREPTEPNQFTNAKSVRHYFFFLNFFIRLFLFCCHCIGLIKSCVSDV